jgi:hypothetical protein
MTFDIKLLKNKIIKITNVDNDNIEFEMDNKLYYIFPFCEACDYNDEVLVMEEVTSREL